MNESSINQTVLEEKKFEPFSWQKNENISGKLLSDVVHKIKNSLGGIGGFAALLERDLELDDPRKRLVQRIQDGVGRLNEFVMSLMTLVRVEGLCFEKVQILPLLKDVWRNYWGDGKKLTDQIVFHPEIQNGKIELFADPQMIQHMFFHAIRFVDLFSESVEKIAINLHNNNGVSIELFFINNEFPEDLSEDVNKLVDECEPIEARLSLAIVLKMAYLHRGSVTIIAPSKKQRIMILKLERGS